MFASELRQLGRYVRFMLKASAELDERIPDEMAEIVLAMHSDQVPTPEDLECVTRFGTDPVGVILKRQQVACVALAMLDCSRHVLAYNVVRGSVANTAVEMGTNALNVLKMLRS